MPITRECASSPADLFPACTRRRDGFHGALFERECFPSPSLIADESSSKPTAAATRPVDFLLNSSAALFRSRLAAAGRHSRRAGVRRPRSTSNRRSS